MTEQQDSPVKDWRDTVFLPKTDFPMKAGLPQKEPGFLARWEAENLYGQVRAARKGREKFILHDGPPYANGDMHIGHAMQRILKDMVVRSQSLLGKDAPFVPGWDCHGLPIEWKVEEEYRKKKLNKDEVPVEEFRAECRAYAQNWVNIQRDQLKRLGLMGDWDNPYLTMDFQAEATIVAELMKFAESGQLYRGAKPVMWSPVEKTALAEAEVEYEDITSTQIDVAFEIISSPIPELVGAYAVIWTTTPWTIPVNQAIAYGADVEYVLLSVTADTVGVGAKGDKRVNEVLAAAGLPFHTNGISKFLVAKDLSTSFADRLNKAANALDFSDVGAPSLQDYIDPYSDRDASIKGSDLVGTMARHPMAKLFRQPALDAGLGLTSHPVVQEDSQTPHQVRGDGEGTRVDGGENIDLDSTLAEFFLRPRPFLDGSAFVTTDAGTGLVHMAPDHGEDDFDLCKANGLEPVFAVEGDGKYRADWAWLGGQGSVINPKFNAPDGPICTDLRDSGGLLAASADYKHSYPHSWRSKAKVIYRCTPQWFVGMDTPLSPWEREGAPEARKGEGAALAAGHPRPGPLPTGEGEDTLRSRALSAIAATRFVPEKGRNRINSMVEGRPDWVLSRQRAWGVPITLFVNRKTGQYLNDPAVNARIIAAVRDKGVDGWCDDAAQGLLGDAYALDDYERVTDILDVWFDSGCTHAFVLESGRWPDVMRPEDWVGPRADLYLEGTDQHRGWFQSSLLESCGTRGHAPYKAVLTHGFTMDAKGLKMSKSLGNTINPIKLMEHYGADILRLWALSVDFTEDHRIGDEILKGVSDQYRKLRNTFRYLLGALEGFSEDERVADVADMPELERYMLHLLAELDGKLRVAIEAFDFNTYTRLLSDFANNDLSAFFFDIRKDSLYCDALTSPKRRAYRTVLDIMFHALVRYAAPVLVFTSEEVWGTRYPDGGSVHLLEWPEVPFARRPVLDTGLGLSSAEQSLTPDQVRGDGLMKRWTKLRSLRSQINEAIEHLRRDKTLGSSLEANVSICNFAGLTTEITDLALLEEVFIVAEVTDRNDTDALQVTKTTHHKCGRCWRHLPEVSEDGALCARCEEVVGG